MRKYSKDIIYDFRCMNRKVLLFLLLFCLSITSVPGQALPPDSSGISLAYPVYSQYLQNGLVINPGYTGSRGALSGFLSYRKQWMGTTGSPVMQSVSLHAPVKNERIAFGVLAQFMQFGYNTKASSFYGSYAYRIKIRNGKLSFGLKGGVDMSNTDYSGIKLTDKAIDPVFTGTDKYVLPNVGAGAYYYNDKYFAGVSVPSFLSYRKTSTGSVQAHHSFNEYDLIFSAGGLITFSDFLKFKPSVLLNYSFQDTKKISQLDINGNLIFADIFWLGGSWRTSEQVAVGILQFQVTPKLMFGFSYDYPVGRMNSYSHGSSEFILRYEFGSKVSAANPRYF
ncbi:MAG TPA: type IX secretion system membrane protein PorP/SprF [Bacteroidales bacterium]|nr:type IX secretion system membrane protein PorP/SprF [Bacteroidales bacterium]